LSTMISNSASTNVINKMESIDTREMLETAIKTIGELSGEEWSNYNPADPGITILENLCYGLLDQNYKGDFSIEDLMTQSDGNIPFRDHLHLPDQVMFTNPVTLQDFRKLLIDRTRGIRNVWIEPIKTPGAFQGSYKVQYDLSDEFKLKLLGRTKKNRKLETPFSLKRQLHDIHFGIAGLLYMHRNLGEIFLKPECLAPRSYWINGHFYIKTGEDVEKTLARIYFQLNNYCSQYVTFHTYGEMKDKGYEVSEIMDGPRLNHGFIESDQLTSRPSELDFRKLVNVLLDESYVEQVASFSCFPAGKNEQANQTFVKIPKGTVPFFNYTCAAHDLNRRYYTVYYGGKRLKQIDQSLLNSYYEDLVEVLIPEGYFLPTNLGPVKPIGRYRNLKKFYSIQALFPSAYGLATDHDFSELPTERRGQIKQLKGFLMIIEQLIANHQNHLANINDTLSFDSYVEVGNPLCHSAEPKGLYHVPAARHLIKAFDVFNLQSQYLDEYPHTTWKLFCKDKSNDYISALSQANIHTSRDIKQRADLLAFRMATLGEEVDLSALVKFNPKYGDYDLARVEMASNTLKNYEGISGNVTRSYFELEDDGEQKVENEMFSGLERKLDLSFQITGYYDAFVERINKALKDGDPFLKIQNKPSIDGKKLNISYYDESIITTPHTHKDSDKTLKYHLSILQKLIDETKGFVLIDNSLLISLLPDDEWTVKVGNKPVVVRSPHTGVKSHQYSHKKALHLLEKYKDKFDGKASVQSTRKGRKTHHVSSISPYFLNQVSVFLPDWLDVLKEPAFKRGFTEALAVNGPMHLEYNIVYLGAKAMSNLLVYRRRLMGILRHVQKGMGLGEHYYSQLQEIIDFVVEQSKKQTG
jgi:hypothetical protein